MSIENNEFDAFLIDLNTDQDAITEICTMKKNSDVFPKCVLC